MSARKITKMLGVMSLLPLLLTLGCRSLPHSVVPDTAEQGHEILSQHVLEVDKDGFAYDLKNDQENLIRDPDQLREYLQGTIVRGFQQSGKKKLLVFVHGGLNMRDEGRGHFWHNYKQILDAGYYPVFIVWPSGWANTYWEHLMWVRQGLKADTVPEKIYSVGTSPFTLLADFGRAAFRLPLVIANNSVSEMDTVNAIRNVENGAAVSNYWAMNERAYVVVGDDYTLFSDWCLRAASYWPTLTIKYLTASWVDGFGKGAWDNMLRRTQEVYPARYGAFTETNLNIMTAVSTNTDALKAAGPRSVRQQRRANRYASGGLPMFIETLHRLQAKEPSLEVSLVGHSMGTIILNRVVRDAPIDVANIVYMGAACSVGDFSQSVLPYLNTHPKTQFYNLSLHPVAEAGEWQTFTADLVPRGSLLVWIDNFLSNPVTEQERTLGRWRNLFRSDVAGMPIVSQFYVNGTNLTDRLHFLAFSAGFGNSNEIRGTNFQWNLQPLLKNSAERVDNPLTHGEFSEMPYWKPEFWWNTNIARVKVPGQE